MIILDTNVLSETTKPAPAASVAKWLRRQDRIFTTTVTQAEILYGLALLPEGKRRAELTAGTEKMFTTYLEGRILPFDESAAREFGPMMARLARLGRPIPQMDAMIAAIAKSRGAALATRNVADFQHCGVRIINPWDP